MESSQHEARYLADARCLTIISPPWLQDVGRFTAPAAAIVRARRPFGKPRRQLGGTGCCGAMVVRPPRRIWRANVAFAPIHGAVCASFWRRRALAGAGSRRGEGCRM